MTGLITGLARGVIILVLVVSLLALLGAGALAGLSWIGDAPLGAASSVAEEFGFHDGLGDLRLPALWARFSPYVYACASIAGLSVVLLFVVRRRKPVDLSAR